MKSKAGLATISWECPQCPSWRQAQDKVWLPAKNSPKSTQRSSFTVLFQDSNRQTKIIGHGTDPCASCLNMVMITPALLSSEPEHTMSLQDGTGSQKVAQVDIGCTSWRRMAKGARSIQRGAIHAPTSAWTPEQIIVHNRSCTCRMS
jgi:hypothetical protein